MSSNDNPVNGNVTTLNQGLGEPGFERTEPLLDIERFRNEYFPGIPLVSALTQESISDETLKMFIKKGVSDFETSVRIPVHPVRQTDRFDYERADDMNFSTRRLTRWPLLKVESLQALYPGRSPGQEAEYPTNWVVPQGDTGLIRITPISGASTSSDFDYVASVGYRAAMFGGFQQWPNLWVIQYLAGFDFDKIPSVVNDLIGTMAAIKLLSAIGPIIFPHSGYTIGLDGMSQAVSTLGPAFLAQRLQELSAERDRLVLQLKNFFGTDIQMFAF